MDILYYFCAFTIILGGLAVIQLFFPVKEDPDMIDDVFEGTQESSDSSIPSDLINVPGHMFLYYSPSTRYVYSTAYVNDGTQTFEEFISHNRPCKYLKGRIVEVVDDKIVAILYNTVLPG